MSSFTVSGDVQVDGFGFPVFTSRLLKRKSFFSTGARRIAAASSLANRSTYPVSAGRRFSGEAIEAAYMGSTLFQKFLSKTIVGKFVTKAVGKIPIVGKVAQTGLETYRDTNVQQPKVSLPAVPPVTVADVTPGAGKKPFPMVPVAIGAGVLVVAAVLMLKK